jgi:hypothetical protein
VLNIAIAKSPWVQETESRGIGKRLVRQHHLLHNESLALCQQMSTCSLSESVVCSSRWWVRTARFCVQEGCFLPCKMTPVSPHLTPPRLRTGESMRLVSFWSSPTPRARRERQRRASGTGWWVGTARFCVQEGCFFSCKMTPVSPHLTPPRLI